MLWVANQPHTKNQNQNQDQRYMDPMQPHFQHPKKRYRSKQDQVVFSVTEDHTTSTNSFAQG